MSNHHLKGSALGELAVKSKEVMNMSINAWAKPCPNSDPVFDGVHEWLSQKARRSTRRVVKLDWLDLVDAISRAKNFTRQMVSDALTSLLDLGWIEKQDEGFLVTNFFSKVSAVVGAADSSEVAYRGAVRYRAASEASEASRAHHASPECVQNYGFRFPPRPRNPFSENVVLAGRIFPTLCQEGGIPISKGFTWTRLAAGINQWMDDGLDVSYIRQLMEEFASHPEMAQRSSLSPDQLFLARRQKLSDLVWTRQRRDPGNRRNGSGSDYWLGRRQERHTQGAEYWLGKYA